MVGDGNFMVVMLVQIAMLFNSNPYFKGKILMLPISLLATSVRATIKSIGAPAKCHGTTRQWSSLQSQALKQLGISMRICPQYEQDNSFRACN